MKILQLNVWSLHLAPAIVDLLRKENPDIVCLQEVVSAPTSKILNTIEEVLEDYPFEYTYYSPLVRFNFMHGKGQRGNMILSRYPIVKSDTFWTAGEFQEDFDYTTGYNSARGVAHATIESPDGPIEVLTTHGYHVREHKNGNPETLKACRQIADYISGLSGRVVLTGDFNLVPESESIGALNAIMRNLCIENDVQTTRNSLTPKTETCDYIFVNKETGEVEFDVLDDVVSDHKALIVIVE